MFEVEDIVGGSLVDRVLRERPFLDCLSPDGRELLISNLAPRRCSRDEVVVTQRDEDAEVFVILKGLARATIFSDDGKLVAYRDILEGDIFGEVAAIDGDPRSASVVAVTDLNVGVLSPAQFQSLVDSNTSFRWALLSYFARQSRSMTERIFEFSTMLVRDRLIQELLRLAGVGDADNGTFVVDPAPTHFELAARISTHREAVSREMSHFTKLKLVSKTSGHLLLHDVRALREQRSCER